MEECFKEASLALVEREVPVGCAIVDSDGHILATGRNATNKTRNSTYHAELVALAQLPSGINLSNCVLYVTIEPCIMCAAALSIVGLTNIIYFARNNKFGGCGSVLDVNNHIESPWTKLNAKYIHDERAIYLLQEFFERKNPMIVTPNHGTDEIDCCLNRKSRLKN
ncbi:Cytosine deaminase, putative [Giardia lamblia P15]|uniref:Cytosine deaminase, putative n=1 Tax=Giardia intestinalis (strain P15) TaxID=658858 RepID=E1F2F4_GIAIA|nr:Cytosine deaminase, putative [Giardia lamblia P15]